METLIKRICSSCAQFDHRCFALWHARPHHLSTAAARAVSKSADGWLYAFFPLLYLLMDPYDRSAQQFCWTLALAVMIERVLYTGMKTTFKRRRPPELWPTFQSVVVASDRFSLPSGHTSAAFMFCVCCSVEFGPLAMLVLAPWACAVGASRVILGVHFPTDILAGALLGSSVALSLI